MKKIITLVLTAVLVLGICTCANAENDVPTEVKGVGEVVLDVLTWPFNNGLDQVGETFTSTLNTVGEFVENTWNAASTWVVDISNDVGSWFSGIFGCNSEKVGS